MKDFSAFLDMRRYKNWAHKIGSWKYLTIWRPVLPVFPRAQRASFLLSILNSFQGVLKISSSAWFNPCRGRWQVTICSWQKFPSSCFGVIQIDKIYLIFEGWKNFPLPNSFFKKCIPEKILAESTLKAYHRFFSSF